MVFVPIVPGKPPASARAQDLGRRLKAEVEKFELQYPGTSPEDIRAAADLAIGTTAGPSRPQRVAARFLGIVSVAVAVVGGMFASAAARGESLRVLFPAVIALAAVPMIIAIVAFVRSRRPPG